ncbi:S1 family peptidase [Rhodopirellula islandica]|uniref:S1 family peptidase n=1 Tax=Rhodopirellula islandica TaxID=595434 RepID=UPI00064B4129|nr:serine protease [Rhodopirellula islandica]
MKLKTRLVAVVVAITLAGCDQAKNSDLVIDNREPVSWINSPHSEWPQVLLTNYAEFDGHTSLEGASSFLVKNSKGAVVAITARHLLSEQGGVEPAIAVDRVNDVLKGWILFPRDNPDEFVRLRGITLSDMSHSDEAWNEIDFVVLDLAENPPSQFEPLPIRISPIQVGEKVYLFGIPYDESGGQNIYSGTVTERSGTRFRYDITPSANIRGFSGAPIVDSKGYVVGLMTVWFHASMDGDNYLEAGGQDIGLVVPDISSRASTLTTGESP